MTAAFGLKCPDCHAVAPQSSSAELDRRCSLIMTAFTQPVCFCLSLRLRAAFSFTPSGPGGRPDCEESDKLREAMSDLNQWKAFKLLSSL